MLERYDSGMADRMTSNAISLAIQNVVKEGIQVQVFTDRTGEKLCCRVNSHEFPLPARLVSWLNAAECGIAIRPASFAMTLPKNWLRVPPSSQKKEKAKKEEKTSIAA